MEKKKNITQIVNYGLSGQGAGKKSGWKTTPMCKKGKQSIVMCKCNGPHEQGAVFPYKRRTHCEKVESKMKGKEKNWGHCLASSSLSHWTCLSTHFQTFGGQLLSIK